MKSFTWETLHVRKTLKVLVTFTIDTTYNSIFCRFLDLYHKISDVLDVIGKMAFIFVFSWRKAKIIMKIQTWYFFLQASVIRITLACKKKFPRVNFWHSISFSPAEYEYEKHFFPSRQDFPTFYDKGLKINKISCL